MELIKSPNAIYINGGHQNNTTKNETCEVVVSSHQDILTSNDDYHIHLVRWEIDTFSNLFYLKGDPSLQYSVELMRADPIPAGAGGGWGEWISRESFLGTFDENQPSLSAFLNAWNSQHSQTAEVKLHLSIDGGGRFKLQAEKTALADPTRRYGVQVQLSDPLSSLLHMSKLSSFVEFDVGPKRVIMQQLDFLEAVIREDDAAIIFAPDPTDPRRSRWVDTLKAVARNMLRYDQPVFNLGAGAPDTDIEHVPHDHVLDINQQVRYHIQPDRFATIYWEHTVDDQGVARRVPNSRVVYVNNLSLGNVYQTNADPGYNEAWTDHWDENTLTDTAQNPPSIIFPVEFIDSDLLWGVYKNEAIIDDLEAATPNVLLLDSVTLDVVVGDMLEIRIDPAALGGTLNQYESRPEAAGWAWTGHSLVYPITEVLVAGGNTTITLMYPLPAQVVTDIRTRSLAGDDIRVHITEKRPPFIPLINRYDVPDGNFDAAGGTLDLIGNVRVEAGDTLYLESKVTPFPQQGPFTITTATINAHGSVAVDFNGTNVTYTAATHRVVIGSARRVDWYLEDIRRLRLAMLATVLTKTTVSDWHTHGQNNMDLLLMKNENFRVLATNALLYNHGHFPISSDKARLPASDDLHALLQPSNKRMLELPDIHVTSTTNVPGEHTIMRERRFRPPPGFVQAGDIDVRNNIGHMGSRRADFGFFEVELPPDTIDLFEEYEREALGAGFAVLQQPGFPGGPSVICGVNDGRLVCFRADGAINVPVRMGIYNEFKFTINAGHSELLLQTLKVGNRSLSVQSASHQLGNPLNMGMGDFIVSDIQGAVDEAQYFQFLNITSRDIGVVPERDSSHNSLFPIVSSFQLPSNVTGITCDKSGNVTGFSENFYGTVRFVESGQRRFHKLRSIPGSLRQFSLSAEAVPRDRSIRPVRLTLHPGEAFTFQLLFVHGW